MYQEFQIRAPSDNLKRSAQIFDLTTPPSTSLDVYGVFNRWTNKLFTSVCVNFSTQTQENSRAFSSDPLAQLQEPRSRLCVYIFRSARGDDRSRSVWIFPAPASKQTLKSVYRFGGMPALGCTESNTCGIMDSMPSLNRWRLSLIPFGLPAGLPEAPFVNCTSAPDENSKYCLFIQYSKGKLVFTKKTKSWKIWSCC